MEKYKIKVNNEAESKEVQELLLSWGMSGIEKEKLRHTLTT